MYDKAIESWIAVNRYMRDDYRETVVELAVRHLPDAPRDLQAFAKKEIAKAISLPGYRTVARAPVSLLKPHITRHMQLVAGVATAVICLWADAMESLISILRTCAESKGLQFRPDWSWREARDGFLDFEEIPVLNECTEALVGDKSGLEADHLRLATLWLSRALVSATADQAGAVPVAEVDGRTAGETQASSAVPIVDIIEPSAGEKRTSRKAKKRPTEPATPVQADSLPSDVPPQHTVLPVRTEHLPALVQSLVQQADQTRQARQSVVDGARLVQASAEMGDCSTASAQAKAVLDQLARWDSELQDLRIALEGTMRRLVEESESRPDLTLNAPSDPSGSAHLEAASLEDLAAALQADLKRVLDHDERRRATLSQLSQVRETVLELQRECAVWTEGGLIDVEPPQVGEAADAKLTLGEARAALGAVRKKMAELGARLADLRDGCLKRIEDLADTLRELGVAAEAELGGDLLLGSLCRESLVNQPSKELRSLEQRLAALVEVEEHRPSASSLVAAELRAEWRSEKLAELLSSLATEQRDAEALLLLLAANAVSPSDTLSLPRPVVHSLLGGMGQLAGATSPFELANLLAQDLLSGWRAGEPLSAAEMCLVYLAAHCVGSQRLPDEALWQLAVDWPVDGMPSWNRLWPSVLTDEPLSILVDTSADQASRLEVTRSQATNVMAREHGLFVQLKRKDPWHSELLGTSLMPGLADRLDMLRKLDQDLQEARPEKLEPLLARLEELLAGDIANALSEETLVEHYENSAAEAGIDDSKEQHNRRAALRILSGCAESILQYGRALVEFWRARLQREAGVASEQLLAELSKLPDLAPLAEAAVDEILHHVGTRLPERNDTVAKAMAQQLLTREILTQATYALRLPRVVRFLTASRLEWAKLLDHLLDDIAEPVEPLAAAALLMEMDAPDQVLLLTQHITLDLQKQAQSLKRNKEHETDDLQTQLLRVGGSSEELLAERQLGRWRFLIQELRQRVDATRAEYESAQEQVQARAHQLRSEIYALNEAVFETRGTMSTEVYRLVDEGLNLAKKATENAALFREVDAYLKEISYRLEHASWSLDELQGAAAQLERAMAGEAPGMGGVHSAEQVMDLMERGELRQLGLAPDDVTPSEIDTRCELLRNWLAVRELPGFLSEDLKIAERSRVQSLHRLFAQMVVMRQTRGVDGKPLASETPAVHSFWELQYPKTKVLETQCILVALPGHSPSARDLAHVEHLVDDREWLEMDFVLLFVPGCTPKIRLRLLTNYKDRGLVILDEPAILDMVLAESESKKPLGRLRPMMLNACGAENVDIFTINQLVNSRTAIFVGRDRLVARISSSGGNYALYGGRRIGKSSVLQAIQDRLERQGVQVVSAEFEGDKDNSDDASAVRLATQLGLDQNVSGVGDFKSALQSYLDASPELDIVFLLDEVDRYIQANPDRHVLIEALRALSDRYGNRVRVLVAGFMALYDCLNGRGPYTPTSDPWRRMLNDIGPVRNLKPEGAERIVKEGFLDILGWRFESRAIPQWIVERTGGHPAFVQCFCMKVQERAASRGDRLVRLEDVEEVFADPDPRQSFIAYVRETLKMNLDPIARYVILWLAEESSEAQGFTLDQVREIASTKSIPEDPLLRSLEHLVVNSVVRERSAQVYEFTVPDYPFILSKLGDTKGIERAEEELERFLQEGSDAQL